MNDTHKEGFDRRTFFYGLGGAVALVGIGGGVKLVEAEELVRPPGGQDEDFFIATCTRCEKCREACPTRVIVPARIETGLLNARTPTMNFSGAWCDYCEEGNGGVPRCVEVCPTGSLSLPSEATPETTIIGLAYLNRDWCLGWQLKGCRICYDVCPYEALEIDDLGRISVLTDVCNGCGLCEKDCISMKAGSIQSGATERAITIKPLSKVLERLASEGRDG